MTVINRGPLLVRLCNWVGEVVLSLPALRLLADSGYELELIGGSWAASLLEGHGWTVHSRPKLRKEAIAQIRALRHQLQARTPGVTSSANILLFTSSFSSALEARLAGLKPVGDDRDGRRLLLSHRVPFVKTPHAADHYWRLASHFLDLPSLQRPSELGLTPSSVQHAEAQALIEANGLREGFVLLCPFSGSDDPNGEKKWPAFQQFIEHLNSSGVQSVVCPGPGEEAFSATCYPQAIQLLGVKLGTYAALAQRARCTISNDTGPGHLAAGAGGRVISIFGPDGVAMWTPIGRRVTVLKPTQGWPELDTVLTTLAQEG
jgi:heptosyltransferase-2